MMAFDDTSSFMIMDFQLSGSLWEQMMVLFDNSIRFSKISRSIFTSRSSVIEDKKMKVHEFTHGPLITRVIFKF